MSDLPPGLRDGDAAAFDRFVRDYGDRLFRFACRMVGADQAEDVTQEVFIRVLKSPGPAHATGSFDGWLFSIANNLCIDHLRRRTLARERERSRGEPVDETPPSRSQEAEDLRQRLRQAVEALPVEQKQVFLMREEGGLAFREIAEILGCPLSTALARMRYAMDRLKETMKAHRELI